MNVYQCLWNIFENIIKKYFSSPIHRFILCMYNCKLIELFNLLIVLIFDSDNGMKYMIGDDWRSLFDVIVVQARKPSFFKKESR